MSQIRPNTWNPNVLPESVYNKVKNGVKALYAQGQVPPPIIVRTLPDGERTEQDRENGVVYEIIDGAHRFQMHHDLNRPSIPCHVLNVSISDAMKLTPALNYLKGTPKQDEYAALLKALVVDHKVALSELANYVTQDADGIQEILAKSSLEDFDFDDLLGASVEAESSDDLEDDENDTTPELAHREKREHRVTLTFDVEVDQAEVIQNELNRIAAYLKANGDRAPKKLLVARALEYMAATSAGVGLP